MINTTQTREKKRRGLGSVLGHFGGKAISKSELLSTAPVIVDFPATMNESLLQILNRFIARAISFDVQIDAFTVCQSTLLTEDEKQFVETSYDAILCTLQQALLCRELFDVSAAKLKEFSFDIAERQGVIGETETDENQIYFDAVCDVSKRWFTELLAGNYERLKEEALAIAA